MGSPLGAFGRVARFLNNQADPSDAGEEEGVTDPLLLDGVAEGADDRGLTDDLIERSAADREAGVSGLPDDLDDVLRRVVDVERHDVRAPVDGVADSRMFELGERPNPGQAVMVLLAGDQVFARVYVPEQLPSVCPSARRKLPFPASVVNTDARNS